MKALPGSLTHAMTILSASVFEQKETITNIEVILLRLDEKAQLFHQLPICHEKKRNLNLKRSR